MTKRRTTQGAPDAKGSPSHSGGTKSGLWWAVPLLVALVALYVYTALPPSPTQAAAIRESWRSQCRARYDAARTRVDSMRIDISPPDTLDTSPRSRSETCGELRVRGEL